MSTRALMKSGRAVPFAVFAWMSAVTLIGCASPVPSAERSGLAANAPVLERRVSINLRRAPLSVAVDRLREASGANVFVNWRVLGEAGVRPEAPVELKVRDVPFGQALDLLLAGAAGGEGWLGYEEEGGVIRVSTFDDLQFGREARLERERDERALRVEMNLRQALPALRVENVTLREAVDRIARETGVTIFPRWLPIESAGVTADTRVSAELTGLTARQALDVIFLQAKAGDTVRITYRIRGDALEISTQEEMAGNTEARVYDLRDLLRAVTRGPQMAGTGGRGDRDSEELPRRRTPRDESLDVLTKLIQQSVDPDSWRDNGGSVGALWVMGPPLDGHLVVTQSHENHRSIRTLLHTVRARLRHRAP